MCWMCDALGELPESAPAPIAKRKKFRELGTKTAQAEAFAEAHSELSPDELLAAAERERERLEDAGEISMVGDGQPAVAPDFPSLVGRELDIRWRYWTKEGGKRKSVYIWCTGVVAEIADGVTTKKTPRCKSPLPWGSVRMRMLTTRRRSQRHGRS